MSPTEEKLKIFSGSDVRARTRLLLTLWDLLGDGEEVKKSLVTDKLKRKKEKAEQYKQVYEALLQEEAIVMTTKKRMVMISLTKKGEDLLIDGLLNDGFEFDGSQVAVRLANALLVWFRKIKTGVGVPVSVAQVSPVSAISSYDEFVPVVLQVYEKLNQEDNCKNLVPIYRIRQKISEKVSRSQFNDWLLEMQANDIFQLIGGEMPNLTADKQKDSITVPGGGWRYYAKRLDSQS